MKVIKRDGRAVDYDREKIRVAITKANEDVCEDERVSNRQIENIIKYIEIHSGEMIERKICENKKIKK